MLNGNWALSESSRRGGDAVNLFRWGEIQNLPNSIVSSLEGSVKFLLSDYLR